MVEIYCGCKIKVVTGENIVLYKETTADWNDGDKPGKNNSKQIKLGQLLNPMFKSELGGVVTVILKGRTGSVEVGERATASRAQPKGGEGGG